MDFRSWQIPFLLLRAVVHFSEGRDINQIVLESNDIEPALAYSSGFEQVPDDTRRIYYYKGYID